MKKTGRVTHVTITDGDIDDLHASRELKLCISSTLLLIFLIMSFDSRLRWGRERKQ